jgi:hypothetical protein
MPELMSHFDFSDPEMPNSKRTSTIVPQQALYLMNSPMAIDVARRVVARRDVLDAGDNLDKVFKIYRVIFQRSPSAEEIQIALNFVGHEKKQEAQIAAAARS